MVISHMCIPFLIAFLSTLVVYIIVSRRFLGNSAYGKKDSFTTRVVPTTYWRVGTILGVEFEDKSNWLVVRTEEVETTRGGDSDDE